MGDVSKTLFLTSFLVYLIDNGVIFATKHIDELDIIGGDEITKLVDKFVDERKIKPYGEAKS